MRRQWAVRHAAWLWLAQDAGRGGHAHYATQLRGWNAGEIGGVCEGDLISYGDTCQHLKVAQPFHASQQLRLNVWLWSVVLVVGGEGESAAHLQSKFLDEVGWFLEHLGHFRV